jgi:hypothetical protein
MRNKRILTLVFVVIAIALLFSGCCPEICPTIPDCVCPDCPDCDCPNCPDCVCPGEGLPDIVLFETDPDTIWQGKNDITISNLDWLVTGADVVFIDQNIGYVGAAGSQVIDANNMPLGVTTYTLKATNSVGSSTATATITVNPIRLGELAAEEFGWIIDHDGGSGLVTGYYTEFVLTDATFEHAQVVMRLYAGTQLLQTNTLNAGHGLTVVKIGTSFDVFGTFDYVADGYWTNVREVEYGQSMDATKVIATVTLNNGKVVTAENTNPANMP